MLRKLNWLVARGCESLTGGHACGSSLFNLSLRPRRVFVQSCKLEISSAIESSELSFRESGEERPRVGQSDLTAVPKCEMPQTCPIEGTNLGYADSVIGRTGRSAYSLVISAQCDCLAYIFAQVEKLVIIALVFAPHAAIFAHIVLMGTTSGNAVVAAFTP